MKVSPLIGGSIRDSNSDIVLVEGEIEGATGENRLLIAPYHIHHTDPEIFYVLAGRIGFEIDDEILVASAGDAVLVPPGAIHCWWTDSPKPARYLIAMPKRLDDLIRAIHAEPRDPEAMAQLYRDYDSTLIGWTR